MVTDWGISESAFLITRSARPASSLLEPDLACLPQVATSVHLVAARRSTPFKVLRATVQTIQTWGRVGLRSFQVTQRSRYRRT